MTMTITLVMLTAMVKITIMIISKSHLDHPYDNHFNYHGEIIMKMTMVMIIMMMMMMIMMIMMIVIPMTKNTSGGRARKIVGPPALVSLSRIVHHHHHYHEHEHEHDEKDYDKDCCYGHDYEWNEHDKD